MNGSGGSSGTRTPQSVCAIDFSCTAAEKGAGDGVAAGTPAGWHRDGSHVPCCPCPRSPWGQCQTEDPPALPWDAQHGPSGPDAGVPPVPCRHLPAQPSPRPAPRWARGGAGMEQPGGCGEQGHRGACPRHQRITAVTHAASCFLPCAVALWGCVTAMGLAQGKMQPMWPVGSPGSSCPAQSAHGCRDAGTPSAPQPGEGWQDHGAHSAPWGEESTGCPTAPGRVRALGCGAE